MIVWTDDALFTGPYHDLDRLALLRNAARRRHTLIVSMSPADPLGRRNAPQFDAWLAGLPQRLQSEIMLIRQQLEIVSVTAVTRGAQRVLVCDQDPGAEHVGCRLSLEHAVRTLSLPLYILVEHQLHDGAFIRRVLPPAWRARFTEWERRGELRFENGCGLPVISALVEYHCDDQCARLAFGLPSEIWRLLHFIIFDHDGDHPNTPGSASGDLGRACDKVGMTSRWYRLRRRNQEHYLPMPALRQIVNTRVTDPADRERRLASLDAHEAKGEQRHYLPLAELVTESFIKKAFKDESESWPDHWFEDDGAWPEMTRLAEQIASAM